MKLRLSFSALIALVALLCISSCTSRRDCWADAMCMREKDNHHLLKWEVYPNLSGDVKVYTSLSSDSQAKSRYVGRCKASENQFLVKHDPRRRTYYTLKFNNGVELQVAERQVYFPKAHNMRDVGGYQTATRGRVRWGRIFRTGHIDTLHQWERRRLEKLGIRTVIDLREKEEFPCELTQYRHFNYIHLPLAPGNKQRMIRGFIEGQSVDVKDPEQLIFDMIHKTIYEHTDDFRHMFSVLKSPESYPVLIQGAVGKGRVGVAVALLLAAIDVRYEEIVKDYQLSNDYLHIPTEIKAGYQLPVRAQVAVTHMYTAREKYMDKVFETINEAYGSLDNYFSQALGLSKSERAIMTEALTVPLRP